MITHTIIELKAVALVATAAAAEVVLAVAKPELIVEKTDLKRPRLQLKQSK
jgi:hypothetical protein